MTSHKNLNNVYFERHHAKKEPRYYHSSQKLKLNKLKTHHKNFAKFDFIDEEKSSSRSKKSRGLAQTQSIDHHRNSLPPTGTGKVNLSELKNCISKSSLELDNCIQTGDIPIFGYPAICFSPVYYDKEVQRKQFWQKLFVDTIQNKKLGQQTKLQRCLDEFDHFNDFQNKLLSDFQKGRYKIQ